MAFDTSTRNRLAKFVGEARRLLTDEFIEQLQSLYGISATGSITPIERLGHLDAEGRELAGTLRQRIAYLVSSHADARDATEAAVARLTREQAFTIVNRLAAIRMAETRGLIVESVGQQYQSKGFKVFESVAGSAIGETFDRYRCYLFCLFDELAIDLGVLFDRKSPQAMLFPREPALLALLDLLDAPDLQPLWAEDETIGWIYQYYNDEAERKKMREESAAPRNSRELAVRNQFFTPRYVVEFLTDNTLGRIWYEMTQGQTTLKDSCRYLVRRPNEIFLKAGESAPEIVASNETEPAESLSQEDLLKQPVHIPHRPLKDPREIRLLDPACGSMHFGLYAFELFTVIYDEAWEIARASEVAANSADTFAPFVAFAARFTDKAAFLRDVPRLIIEHNLHGIDIDPRAAQIAGLSLWLRAQRAWHQANVKPLERPRITRSNIVCAEPMPGDKELLREFVEQQLPPLEQPAFRFLLEKIFDRMTLAGEAGSLLRIEEEIRATIAEAKKIWEQEPHHEQKTLFADATEQPAEMHRRLDLSGITTDGFWERAEERIYVALAAYAEQAEESDGLKRRLFANDAAHGFAFIDLCRKRYAVVVMNPPFGEGAINCRDLLTSSYDAARLDVGMGFIEAFVGKLNADGFLGALTSRTFIANETLCGWRQHFLCGVSAMLTALADLGYGVLDNALVEVAASVISKSTLHSRPCFFIRALEAREKEAVISSAFPLWNGSRQRSATTFWKPMAIFQDLPDSVICYWLPGTIIAAILRQPTIASTGGISRRGPDTGDDYRFLRLRWEVSEQAIGKGRTWNLYAKGGEYSPFFDDTHLLLLWQDDGREVRHFRGSAVKGAEHFYRSGLTYPRRTTSDFSLRIMPAGVAFGGAGQAVFCGNEELALKLLAGAYTRPFKLIVDAFVGSGDSSVSGSAANLYRTGLIENLPHPLIEVDQAVILDIKRAIGLRMSVFRADETAMSFVAPALFSKGTATALGHAAREAMFLQLDSVCQLLELTSVFDTASIEETFRLSNAEQAALDELVGVHPCAYPRVGEASRVSELWRQSEAAIQDQVVADQGARRQITKKAYFADRKLELICHGLRCHPRRVVSAIKDSGDAVSTEALRSFAADVVSWIYGAVVGRWDIRYAMGEQRSPEMPDPFAPSPICPPGMLRGDDGLPLIPEAGLRLRDDGHYLLDVAWGGILVDDPEHPLDIERRVHAALSVIWGDRAEAIDHEACALLGVPTLRDWFRRSVGFFADHLKRYSKSRRQAPIYWPLSTKSGDYTLWIYYPRLNDQTLHKCLADFLDPKIANVEKEIASLTGKPAAKAAELREFLNELKDLRDEIERVIKLPWRPNLNDGVLITASPLWKLFRLSKWSKDLKACWEKLEKGDYDWAHLAYTIWPARVEKVCESDRSIAIAHGLEHLCRVEPPKPKKPRGKKAPS